MLAQTQQICEQHPWEQCNCEGKQEYLRYEVLSKGKNLKALYEAAQEILTPKTIPCPKCNGETEYFYTSGYGKIHCGCQSNKCYMHGCYSCPCDSKSNMMNTKAPVSEFSYI